MSDHLDRAAAIVGGCCAHCDDLVDERLALLDEAGLLATPERDELRAEVKRLRAGIEWLAEDPTWHRGMYGCPRDMVSTDRLIALLNPTEGEDHE